jgi:hypothetical protein
MRQECTTCSLRACDTEGILRRGTSLPVRSSSTILPWWRRLRDNSISHDMDAKRT